MLSGMEAGRCSARLMTGAPEEAIPGSFGFVCLRIVPEVQAVGFGTTAGSLGSLRLLSEHWHLQRWKAQEDPECPAFSSVLPTVPMYHCHNGKLFPTCG